MYYSWSKEFLEAGKHRLAGDAERAASTSEVKELRHEVRDMKDLVADLTIENRKSIVGAMATAMLPLRWKSSGVFDQPSTGE